MNDSFIHGNKQTKKPKPAQINRLFG